MLAVSLPALLAVLALLMVILRLPGGHLAVPSLARSSRIACQAGGPETMFSPSPSLTSSNKAAKKVEAPAGQPAPA